ncbi:MAG: hypothetical protein M9894_17085 [Planctomycetes bacterium]|nr:hypothetical protein [Planctomycetota bacterium]
MKLRRWSVSLRFAAGPAQVVVAVAPSAGEAVGAVLAERLGLDGALLVGVDVAPVAGPDVVAAGCAEVGDGPG